VTAVDITRRPTASAVRPGRYRLNRAGILNVWQYDQQEFSFADGRMLLRGTNGAGKSKTLEMLLPFVLDGDKARMTSSARHHTSLLWLMTDGYDGQARTGYLWVEFARATDDGAEETFTCGVGIRASASARTATAWFFTTTQRVGDDLHLEDDAGPLSKPRLAERIGPDGQVFEQARAYKEHVGRTLFGLATAQYDEVLRLLYWLRQPQVGEDIEPKRLGEQLLQALPQLDEQAVRAAGETFDELAAFGEQIDRRAAAAEALATLSEAYAGYARVTVASRAAAVVAAIKEEANRGRALGRRRRELAELESERDETDRKVAALRSGLEQDRLRIRRLEESPEARSQSRLTDLGTRAADLDRAAVAAAASASRAGEQLSRREARVVQVATDLVNRIHRLTGRVRDVDRVARDAGVDDTPVAPAALATDRLSDVQGAEYLADSLDTLSADITSAERAVGRRQAAVSVVREAVDAHAEGQRECAAHERRAAEAEQRWEDARRAHTDAEAAAAEQAETLRTRLRAWLAEPAAPEITLPDELTPPVLEGLGEAARSAAAPRLAQLRAEQQAAASIRDRAESELVELAERRAAIAAETDPAPPEPVLGRTPRSGGAALWRLLDFRPDLPEEERAGLEAALQASGLLDAWVRPDGAVLDANQLDTVLPVGPARRGRTVLEILQADCAPDGDVTADVVSAVLSRIALGFEHTDAVARVGTDGSWMLGPLQGRAAKDRAQYVGATARAAERRRRLAEVDARIETTRAARDEAAQTVTALAALISDLERWCYAVPPVQPLLQAWASAETLADVLAREHTAHEAAQAAVLSARQVVVRLLDEVHRLARQNDVPDEIRALAALAERLRGIDRELAQLVSDVPPLQRDVRRWAEDRGELDVDAESVETARVEAQEARRLADGVAAELAELTAAVGASVRELQQRLAELQRAVRVGQAELERGERWSKELVGRIGGVSTEVAHAESAVAEQAEVRSAALCELGAVVAVPGMLASAYGGAAAPDVATLAQAADADPRDAVSAELKALAQDLAGLGAGAVGDENAVWRAHSEAVNGPAADHEPRVVEFGRLLTVIGRDEGGECSIGELAARVAAGVERDRGLLTQRERERFEQHILGELGDAIRRRRVEAHELVEAMNGLLTGVTTSQGIRMRLDWRLRGDVPVDAREAIDLLAQPVGALLPEERTTLRDSLHRLIDASRAESPELSYSEHLGVALDYRRWFEFRIRYTRPETEGKWQELHRRSPLSQGEQKVLCYLPLFAAAAAHFTSLAGAAPYAPRLVLLDDAFPKIDVRTHPLLFGLLVQLDLDFVITSERLWGDHDTVPSLAIYEALRDPSQRGIAQYEYRWDGRSLRSIG